MTEHRMHTPCIYLSWTLQSYTLLCKHFSVFSSPYEPCWGVVSKWRCLRDGQVMEWRSPPWPITHSNASITSVWVLCVYICVCKAVSVPYSKIDMLHRAWKAALQPGILTLTPLLNVNFVVFCLFKTLHISIHGYQLNHVYGSPQRQEIV